MTRLTGVVAADIEHVWPVIAPLLQRAVDKSQGDMSVDDIRDALTKRDMQLWVWTENTEITACLVTQIVDYPRRRVCQMPFIAGRSMKLWLACESMIAAWAKEHDCTQLEGFARKGWLRVLPHWRQAWTTIRKDI